MSEAAAKSLLKKTGEHGSVWALVLSLMYMVGDETFTAFAADIVKQEVTKELSAEVTALKGEQEKQRSSIDAVAVEQRVLAEQIKASNERIEASNENLKTLIEVLRSQR